MTPTYQLVKGVVDKLRFYAVKFQSDTELRNRLIRNDELGQRMEHLCQGSKYGQLFSKLNGNRISRDLKQILEELELKGSRLKIFRNWKYDNWMKIYYSDPGKLNTWEQAVFKSFKEKVKEKVKSQPYQHFLPCGIKWVRWLTFSPLILCQIDISLAVARINIEPGRKSYSLDI